MRLIIIALIGAMMPACFIAQVPSERNFDKIF